MPYVILFFGASKLLSSVMIQSTFFSIAKDTLEPLIGQRVPSELYQKITDMVESYEGIVGAHDLIVHKYGPNRSMATIHAEVPNDVSIEASHEIIDRKDALHLPAFLPYSHQQN